MPTSVMQTAEYRSVIKWLKKVYRSDPQTQFRLQHQIRVVEELLKHFWDYQNAKEKLFHPDPNGNLPLVTKELGQDICRKYDALMDYYKHYGKDLPKESSFTRRYDTPHARFIYTRSLRGLVDDMFDELRKQDEDSIEFIREYFRERTAYHPFAEEANIQEMGDYYYRYPFHTAEEIGLIMADEEDDIVPRHLTFENLDHGTALNIFDTSVPRIEKSKTEKDGNALGEADVLAPQLKESQVKKDSNVQGETKKQRKIPKKPIIRAKKFISRKRKRGEKISLHSDVLATGGVVTRSKAQTFLGNHSKALQKK